ncbi:MAG: hypothetical protein R2748_32615 [Bryobacterales bacterium]
MPSNRWSRLYQPGNDIRFVLLTAWQLFVQEAGAGAQTRPSPETGAPLFLVALALAALAQELLWDRIAFLVAQCVSAVLVEQFRWNLPPRFVESAE